MFNNIGKKLQTLAWIAFIIGCIASLILAFTTERNSFNLGILVAGCLISWIGSWALYAFGQITEDIHAMLYAFGQITEDILAMRQESRSSAYMLLYSQAKQLILQQQYQQAIVILKDITAYRDAGKLLYHCLHALASAQIEAGDYKGAYLTLKDVKGDPAIDELMREARYLQAKELLAQDKKEDAYKLLKKILNYKDVWQIIRSDPELSAMRQA